MLVILASLAFVASAAAVPGPSPTVQAPPAKRSIITPFLTGQWNVPSPRENASGAYEIYENGASGWTTYDTDLNGWELPLSGADKAGFRLAGDDSSASIVKYDGTGAKIVQVQYNEGDAGDVTGGVDTSVTISTTFNASALSSGKKSKRDSWLTMHAQSNFTDYNPIPIDSVSFSVLNSECDGDLSFSIEATLANGTTTTKNGTNSVGLTVTRPANITVSVAGHDASGMTIYINDAEPFSAAVGSGNAPTTSISYSAELQYCPD
ncbi:hypothetical protein PLICRDRAFT_32023 [Plicaturopsis crispa FD-325 SS-3]|uniref:Uncharacterized protein n=1 Tax=Plicaturopsis crispa FD-325 SS-3 TaxID=944288 RepID=A0A0C9SLD8_PLICR|nr:hypothetical protein PLICRDRAFT_32023 [Plicaturopsis crispa FD-325 SS-3]